MILEDKSNIPTIFKEEPNLLSKAQYANLVYQKASNTPTPKEWIKYKPGGKVTFAYVAQAFMYELFFKVYPLTEITIKNIDINFNAFWVTVTLEIKDLISGRTEPGVGSARIQISTAAREKYVEKGIMPTQFDVIDLDKNIKSARTQAKKDAIKEFGICADVYQRLVIDPAILQQWREKYAELISIKYPSEIKQENQMKYYDEYKGNKLELIKDLATELGKYEELFGEEVD